jgi:Na+/H+-dicarboxylate symporter
MSLTIRILLGLGLGLALGAGLLAAGTGGGFVDAVAPVGTIWLNALKMTIIPLVLALLVTGIASAADAAKSGGLAGRSIGTFAVLLVTGTLFGLAAAEGLLWLWPVEPQVAAALRAGADAAAVPEVATTWETVTGIVPSNVFAALADGNMLPIVIFGLAFGFAVTRVEAGGRARLVGLAQAVADAMFVIVHWVLWLAPFGVFALALAVGYRTGFGAAAAIGQYVVVVSAVLILQILFVTVPAAVIVGRVPPMRFVRACLPAQAVGFSTQSSLASLPAMLEGVRDGLGVPQRVAGLTLPLAVSLFRITSPAANLAVVLFVAHMYGIELTFAQYAMGVGIALIGSLSVVGVASAATFFVVIVPMCLAMGIPVEVLPLLLAVEVLPDLWRTVGNVTADMAATAIVGRDERDEATSSAASSAAL